MILDKNTQEKPEINYPTYWDFTIIGRDKNKIESAIKEVFGNRKHSCTFSKVSKNGKFTSYKATCHVKSQKERDELYQKFKEHKDINYTL